MKTPALFGVLCLVATSASAQTPIGTFTGTHQEDFTGPQVLFLPCMPNGIFQGAAQLCTPGLSGCHTTGGWSNVCQINAHSPSWLFGSSSGPAEITFNTPAYRFGGYFGTNTGTPDATFDFYDNNNTLISTLVASIPADCAWYWHGWDFPGGVKRILCTNTGYANGSRIMMDDLEVDFTPSASAPVVFCTAGTTSHGCVPAISASAQPSASHANACLIDIAGVEGQRNGLIFFGLDNTNFTPLSWGLGGSSFLCVKSPTVRTPPQSSNGTSAQCDGALALDLDAFTSTNPINPSTALAWADGESMFVQAWFRDPQAVKTTNLSDAVELTFVP